MPIWRVTIDDVKANKAEKVPTGMTVEVKPTLGKAEGEKAGDLQLVKVGYNLLANYKPSVGSIEVGGSIYFIGLDAKKAIKGGKLVDAEAARQAYQRIFVEPMVVAIGLAKELLLPLPIRMPEVKIEPVEGKKSKKK
jgi:hypothetical protein